ncbi:transmembrane protein UsgS [Rhizophagus clarus]|uniref:Transmembrane protein UsgS n=2 Tax=Rhizophagus clarus TaxID=94130 RepID=A0A8H3QTN3_9GLOM|nr:transmembrane protein UsgS [Rhizophagus clarus]
MTWSLTQVVRGLQLAWWGTLLAFKNRHLHKHTYVKTTFVLVVFSIILYLLTSTLFLIPLKLIQLLVYLFSFIFRYDHSLYTENYNVWITNYVFNLPFLGLMFMRYIYPQPLDSLFIESLHHVDLTYIKKHEGEQDLRPPYAPALERHPYGTNYWNEMFQYLKRTWNKIKIAIILYFLSLLPFVGVFVYPVASAYALIDSLGYFPAITIGVFMYVIPGTKSFTMVFLESLYSSRAMMRELLEPYFGRIHFDAEVRRKWFMEREGILFGFSMGFYPLVRLPLFGMLFYGVAQSATALILVKTTEPPPPPGMEMSYKIDYRYVDPRNKKKE